jgi:hypothetical protein
VSILVPLLIVLGLMLLTWGACRMMWDTRWDKIVGGIMLAASMTFISAGAAGLLETIH